MTIAHLARDGRYTALLTLLAGCFLLVSVAETGRAKVGLPAAIRPDRPNEITFDPVEACYVRLVIRAANQSQPCLDEVEIYGPDTDKNLALASDGAKPSASSCISGYTKHAIEHLNDGQYGNDFSWISAGTADEWAQIQLPAITAISKVVFSRDRVGQYADRVPTDIEVLVSLDSNQWQTVAHMTGRSVARSSVGGEIDVPHIPAPPPPPAQNNEGKPLVTMDLPSNKVPTCDDANLSNLAMEPTTAVLASSTLSGYAIHRLPHLNDGLNGNDHSWIAASNPAWAQLDLGDEYWVYHVALGNDARGQFLDRAATTFSILTATQYDPQSNAATWHTVYQQVDGTPLMDRRAFKFQPVRARWIRIAIDATNSDTVRLDEIEVYGQKQPIPLDKITLPAPSTALASQPAFSEQSYEDLLRAAILAEEHAWLKTYGQADLSRRLVPYNGRVKQYPRHAPTDVLPLAPLAEPPALDGRREDACWQSASRGVARVASPYDYAAGPLVETAVCAGIYGDRLFLHVSTDRLLSSHVAVVSREDGQYAGVVQITPDGLIWHTYAADGAPPTSVALEGASDASLCEFEFAVPLSWFPDYQELGLRVGLGMGGQHTQPSGQAVHFTLAPLSLGESGPCCDGEFQVRLTAAGSAATIRLTGNVEPLRAGLVLQPGMSQTISLPAQGLIGPEIQLTIDDDAGRSYRLHLLRYDPAERTLSLLEELVDRFAQQGIAVSSEHEELLALRGRHAELLSRSPELPLERALLFDAHQAKRRLFFRQPGMESLQRILFVKRHAFEPSHNYSVLLDSPYRPGGGICVLSTPYRHGCLMPQEAELTHLFEAGGGIARNPMANFDLTKVYFGYRPSADGRFHIMEMDADGSNLRQITDGPFHDYWPCPLPDGGLAFISTRCRARFLCWRPQAAVLFRMDADGQNIRPLSFANLTEWGPSVMSDGRIIWQRSEYIDKGADFSHTLWAIRPDGTHPELIFGNDIIQPNGYANGREVPGTTEFLCTLISHFGDLNGPLALVDPALGRFNPQAITSLTPEVPWPGMWPSEECFRDGFPISQDLFLCSHAPRNQFGLYVIDRFGNRELLYLDETIGSMCPTLFRQQPTPPILPGEVDLASEQGEFFMANVYAGLEGFVEPGRVKYLRVCQEVRADLEQLPDGDYRADHPEFEDWYATPTHKVQGPFGWPSFVAKASLGIVPVEPDGSVRFKAPAGKVVYFEVLDKDMNELQRMRSVVQLQPGEKRSCVGCHESRSNTPRFEQTLALKQPARELEPPPWGAVPFSYEAVVQPVWDRHCVRCHDANDQQGLNFSGHWDADKVPASYRTLISQGWVHYLDFGWNSGGNEKRDPLTFGTLQSRLWKVLDNGHYEVQLTPEEKRRVKCWTDLDCPLWPDYQYRGNRRPLVTQHETAAK